MWDCDQRARVNSSRPTQLRKLQGQIININLQRAARFYFISMQRFCCIVWKKFWNDNYLLEVELLQHFLQLKKLVRAASKALTGRILCRPTSANDCHADFFSHSIKIRGLLKKTSLCRLVRIRFSSDSDFLVSTKCKVIFAVASFRNSSAQNATSWVSCPMVLSTYTSTYHRLKQFCESVWRSCFFHRSCCSACWLFLNNRLTYL